MPGRGVEPERVVLRREDGQVLERAALLGDDGIKGGTERRGGHLPPPVPRYTREAESDPANHAKPAALPLTSTNSGPRRFFKPRKNDPHNPQNPQVCGVCGV